MIEDARITDAEDQRAVAHLPADPAAEVGVWKWMDLCLTGENFRNGACLEEQPVRITTYNTWAQLEELIPAWEGILSENTALSIFSTPEWLDSWWRAFGSNMQVLALAFSSAGGNLLGLVPFYLDEFRSPYFGKLKCLRLIGDGSNDSDNLDLIVRPGSESACARALLQWLAGQPGWDICCLNTLPEDSAGAKSLVRRLTATQWPLMLRTSPNSAIDLPNTWQRYSDTLSSEFRPLVSRYPKRLAHRYRVRVYRCENASELSEGLEVLFSLHQKRWNGVNQPGSFGLRERREFYARMAQGFLRKGWLEFWFLELNGAPVAAQFCFRYRKSAYVLQEGFDPLFTAEKVGYALRAAMLQHFIELGIERYDFLGGLSAHKQNWGARPGSYLELRFAAPASFGAAFLICERRLSESKQWLRHHLPSYAWNALHRIKAGLTANP